MDLLTQGLLGATMAQSGAKQQETRLATGIGFFAGIVADLDILIQSSNDPLLNIEFHRHFTHSLLFVPLGALIAALLLWPFLRKRLPFARLYWFALLGYCLSDVLAAGRSQARRCGLRRDRAECASPTPPDRPAQPATFARAACSFL